MKKLVLLTILTTTLFACRKHSNTNMVHGTITGRDFRKCACCGGYVLKLDNGDSSNRFFNFPPGTYIDTISFPQSVYLNYIVTDSCGPYRFIKVTSIAK